MWAPDKLIVLRDAPVILLRKLIYRFRESYRELKAALPVTPPLPLLHVTA